MSRGPGATRGSGAGASGSAPALTSRIAHRVPNGLVAAYRDAVSGGRLAWASPAVATVGAYLAFYGLGLLLSGPSPRLPVIALGVTLGLAGLLAGIGAGWRTGAGRAQPTPIDQRLLALYARLLVAIGLLALIGYFIAIGYIPLFQPDLEQSRVDAATQGGALLRVGSLLALPGTWILVAQAAAGGGRQRILVAAGWVVVVALALALTGNRSPAFTALETALVAGLIAAGRARLARREIALLALIGILFLVAAGLFGAFRLASRENGDLHLAGEAPDYPTLTVIAIRGYLVVPVQNLAFTMDAVPDRIGWRLGLTYLQPLLTVLPGNQTTFDADLKAALRQRYAGGGTVPGLLGEAYANFGPVGWFLIPLLVGAAITALYGLSAAATPEMAAFYAFAITHVSIGGILSGLFVASVFPYEAYAILGFAIIGLPLITRWFHVGGHRMNR